MIISNSKFLVGSTGVRCI